MTMQELQQVELLKKALSDTQKELKQVEFVYSLKLHQAEKELSTMNEDLVIAQQLIDDMAAQLKRVVEENKSLKSKVEG